jgi:hypothetical protein
MENTIYEIFTERGLKPPRTITECIEERQGINLSIKANNIIWNYEKKGYAVYRIDYHTTNNGIGYNIVFKKRLFKGFRWQQNH